MLLSLHTGFSFVRATVACASFERASYFENPSETIASRYLKLVSVLSFCPLGAVHLQIAVTKTSLRSRAIIPETRSRATTIVQSPHTYSIYKVFAQFRRQVRGLTVPTCQRYLFVCQSLLLRYARDLRNECNF